MTDNASIPPLNTEADKTTWFKPSLYGGRFTRKQYVLPAILAGIIISILHSILQIILLTPPTLADLMRNPSSIERFQQESMLVGLIVFIPATIFVYLPLGIKRAHDIGHKGTFLITLSIIGLISQVLGSVSYNLGIVLALLISIPGIIYGFILLFKDSQKGTNAYGPSIKYPDTTV